jgi:stage V sporulation protein B
MGMIGVLEVFLKLLVGIGLVYLGYGVVGALTGFLVGGLLTLIIMIYLLRGFKFWKSKEWMDFKVFSFALPMFFGALGITLIQNLDILGIKFLTERVISNELAGYYQAALILARIPLFVVGVIMMAIFPFISKYSRSGSEVYSSTSLRFALLFIFPVTLAIALIPEAFIKLIFPEVYTVGAQALAVVAIGMGFLAIILVLAQIFQALGKPRLPAIILMVTVLLQIIFLLILTPKFGLVGAALSTTLACLFGMAWLAQSYRKIYGLSLDINKALRLFAAFGIAAVSLVLFPHHTRIFTLLDLTLAGAAYLVALALFGLISGSDVDIIAGSMKNERARRVCDAIKNFVVRLNGVLKWRSV